MTVTTAVRKIAPGVGFTFIAAVMIVSFLFRHDITRFVFIKTSSFIESGIQVPERTTLPGAVSPELKSIEQKQIKAAEAALKERPLVGSVTERPEFVSEIEWQVLNEASERRKNSGLKNDGLTPLINKLLFAKKWDAWRTFKISTGNPTLRRDLAAQLLDMIPGQVRDLSLDSEQAKKMSSELTEDLE
jgi:hypothetical protein